MSDFADKAVLYSVTNMRNAGYQGHKNLVYESGKFIESIYSAAGRPATTAFSFFGIRCERYVSIYEEGEGNGCHILAV